MGLLDKGNKLGTKKGKNSKRKPSDNQHKEEVTEKNKVMGNKKIENIGTNIDLIYNTVLEKKKVTLNALARSFKVNPNKVEEWARVLDKQGLLELYYPMVGSAELRIKGQQHKEGKKLDKKIKLLIFAAISLVVIGIIIFFIAMTFYAG